MSSFKDIAFQILKETGKPLHSKEITKIALKKAPYVIDIRYRYPQNAT